MSRFTLILALVVAGGLFAAASRSDGLHELENRILQVVGQSLHFLSFARFAHRYGKRYESVEEIKQRFKVFLDNLKMIRSHNKKGLSYKLGVNGIIYLFFFFLLYIAQNCSATTKGNLKLTNAVLPERKDWREAGIVSPVKNQGKCGSCWTFSTTGALEAAYSQAFGKGISLSEQQLVDCAGAFNNFDCNGGLPSQAFEYIKSNGNFCMSCSFMICNF
uniref:Cysteine proteinase 3-like n=1 Tax=Nicotiana tabacum TaxID=4097 RepID=A0A1S3YUW8_TOBAC|nr:PREDICTED: cysteine proteinase 3-like [Nicotiana tabacum]